MLVYLVPDLNPPEGSECEKRILKNFGRENVLYVR